MPEELERVILAASDGSLHRVQRELAEGYVTAPCGIRVGICGRGIFRDGSLISIQKTSSLMLRLPHEVLRISEETAERLFAGGKICSVLILSPPGCGKTTFLRDLVRLLSDGSEALGLPAHRVVLCDERGELAPLCRGVNLCHIGIHTDVLRGIPKQTAVPMAIRTLNPEIVAMDEISGERDYPLLREAARCGVQILATVHGETARDSPLFSLGFGAIVEISNQSGKRQYTIRKGSGV